MSRPDTVFLLLTHKANSPYVSSQKNKFLSFGEANTDRPRLQQMIINPLSNAIRFTYIGEVCKGGTLTVRRP